jgi:hypothetical protein
VCSVGVGRDMRAMLPLMRGNRTRDARHSQPGFSVGGQKDVPAHLGLPRLDGQG